MKRKVDLTETTKPNLWQRLSSYGNIIGNILKIGTAIGILYGIFSLVYQGKAVVNMVNSDHKIIVTLPENINSLQRESSVRWKEQARLDSAQNKQIGDNPELKAFMKEQQYTLNLVLEEIKKNSSSTLYYPLSQMNLPR
jgi:hypothetical protein